MKKIKGSWKHARTPFKNKIKGNDYKMELDLYFRNLRARIDDSSWMKYRKCLGHGYFPYQCLNEYVLNLVDGFLSFIMSKKTERIVED